MKKKHFYVYRDWIVFPVAIEWHKYCYEYIEPTSRLSIHFLCWHWTWTIKRKRW